ncbi:endonuclease/exonuclease/phosphatase family protein [Roseospira navarrensis]|uniref:Endonuclease/exonuclease/phosphatase domain-containing protein n=1 Tax=Roseospira navarrensis TaxID=140058 RepID=A0A7X1ZBM9_9PROT|nr:endonuclease/exonuclease/phosphatase family protein [Roseospira navarrensis]MQX35563.1 hypothetical protein [Roseospira navarrensis]
MTPPDAPRPSRPPPPGGWDRGLVAAAGLVVVMSPLVALSRPLWPAEIPITLIPLLVGLALVLGLWLALLRHGWAAAVMLGFGAVDLGVMLAAVGPPTLPGPPVASCAHPLRVVTLNVLYAAGDWDRQEAYLRSGGFDLVLMQEIFSDGYWKGRLKGLESTFPHQVTLRESDSVILSRTPLEPLPPDLAGHRALTEPVLAKVPAIAAMTSVAGRDVLVVSAHMPSPKNPAAYDSRTEALARLGDLLAAHEGPAIVGGDFNGVAWSPPVAAFREAAGLRHPDWGPLPIATRPAWLPVAGAQIDYIWPSAAHFTAVQRAGPDVGSDHLPVEADVCLVN